MSTSTRFNLKFLRVFLKKQRHPGKLHFIFFSPKKVRRLFILKEVKPPPDSKMIKLLVFVLPLRPYDPTTATSQKKKKFVEKKRHMVSLS